MAFIPLTSPDIREEDIEAAAAVLRSGMLVQGENVARLESTVAGYLSSPNAIAVSNGTATLHLALMALGIKPGDEVIVPAFTFVATANVVELIGATPVFVDIDINTFNIDAARIEEKITAKTKAIIPVHQFGLACDITAVMNIAKKHGLYVIEDAACALGATQNNQHAGTFGNFGSFSFHPRKAISSGEGGMLTTNDNALTRYVRIKRNHGIDMIDGAMQFVDAGYNYRMTDFQAAILISQFKRLNDIIAYKQELANKYMQEIKHPAVTLPVIPSDRNHTWQTFHVLINSPLDRNKVMASLRAANIGTNYGAQCIPFQKYYMEKYNLDCDKLFPHALRAFKNGLALPIFEKLKPEDISYIANTLNKIL